MTEPLPKAADESACPCDPVSDPPHLPAPVPAPAEQRDPPPPKHERLSARQRRFVAQYLLDCNASAAARRAGYSERNAYSQAQHLMAEPKIARAIRAALDERSYRLKISADRVLLELARIAFSDIGRIIDWSGDALVVEPPGRLSPDDRAAISEIAVIPGDGPRKFAVKVKLHDKQDALRLLARHLRLTGPHAIRNVESPAVAAERIRKLILERHAKLRQGLDDGNAREDG
ncbi:MAG TPA: terminase small subunit [Stellaceae bacterium]|nr:terminase small subunit [Stellaceae bacterium]